MSQLALAPPKFLGFPEDDLKHKGTIPHWLMRLVKRLRKMLAASTKENLMRYEQVQLADNRIRELEQEKLELELKNSELNSQISTKTNEMMEMIEAQRAVIAAQCEEIKQLRDRH